MIFVVESDGIFNFWVSFFHSQPTALSLPLFFEASVRWDTLFEVGLGHGAHVGVLKRRVKPIEGLNVALGAEVDVGETALVSALLSYVHFY